MVVDPVGTTSNPQLTSGPLRAIVGSRPNELYALVAKIEVAIFPDAVGDAVGVGDAA
jgi:hypothetical protein